MARLLLFGRTGQLAEELQRCAAGRVELTALPRTDADFSDPDAPARALARHDATLVINTAGHTNVDSCESDEALAMTMNEVAVGRLAQACAARGLPLIHLSTDYVFGGDKSPYREDDAPAPLNVYGRSKLRGEEAVRAATGKHVILRTSWLHSCFGRNFLKTMLQLGALQEEVEVVCDQCGNPTAAADVAWAILDIAAQIAAGNPRWGLFHYTGSGPVSRSDLAGEIFRQARALGWPIKARVKPVPSSAFPAPARRPLNTALDCSKIAAAYGIRQRSWQEGLAPTLRRLREG
jgi:dTDP-4-dehydrorhamnose reductase